MVAITPRGYALHIVNIFTLGPGCSLRLLASANPTSTELPSRNLILHAKCKNTVIAKQQQVKRTTTTTTTITATTTTTTKQTNTTKGDALAVALESYQGPVAVICG